MNILKEIIKNQLIKIDYFKNRAKQHHSTGLNEREEEIAEVVEFYESWLDFKDKKVLELGPGQTWQVASKIAEQAQQVYILDVEKYIDQKHLETQKIDYKIYDGGKMPYADGEMDTVISYTVYEHIRYPQTTVNETYRVLKSGGEMVHFIDLGDHFSYGVDEKLLFNCLKYSEKVWNWMTWNRSSYVNRLRQSEWIKLHEKAGFTIKHVELAESPLIKELFEAGQLDYLKKIKPEDRFVKSIKLHLQK